MAARKGRCQVTLLYLWLNPWLIFQFNYTYYSCFISLLVRKKPTCHGVHEWLEGKCCMPQLAGTRNVTWICWCLLKPSNQHTGQPTFQPPAWLKTLLVKQGIHLLQGLTIIQCMLVTGEPWKTSMILHESFLSSDDKLVWVYTLFCWDFNRFCLFVLALEYPYYNILCA